MSHCLLPNSYCKCLAKGTVREADGQIAIEHKEALADRLHEIPGINFETATAAAHPLMTGLILDRRNTISLESLSQPPAGLDCELVKGRCR